MIGYRDGALAEVSSSGYGEVRELLKAGIDLSRPPSISLDGKVVLATTDHGLFRCNSMRHSNRSIRKSHWRQVFARMGRPFPPTVAGWYTQPMPQVAGCTFSLSLGRGRGARSLTAVQHPRYGGKTARKFFIDMGIR